jgi:hypothetical protein
MTDELKRLLRESFEYSMTDVHTCFPGVIEKYDAKTRRADVQPSLKRRLPDGSFAAFPIIPDIPVHFPGTKKYTIHFPLEKGDEVSVNVIERSTDIWRDNGGSGIEDGDPRRFNLQDCFAVPGLQPKEFISATEAGLQIIHKDKPDGDLISQVLMTDDKIEMLYKQKAKATMEDDHITAKTDKCTVEMNADILTAKNSKTTIKLNGDKASLNNGGKSLYTIWHTFLQAFLTTHPATFGSPANHEFNPALIQAVTTADTDIGLLLEA